MRGCGDDPFLKISNRPKLRTTLNQTLVCIYSVRMNQRERKKGRQSGIYGAEFHMKLYFPSSRVIYERYNNATIAARYRREHRI